MMTCDLRRLVTILFLGSSLMLSAQAVPKNISHDDLISSFSSKANPFPDPTEDLFIAYPNPVSIERFSIEMEHPYQGALLIHVYDVYGRLYHTTTANKSYKTLQLDIDASSWSNGMYIIAITGEGFRGSQRILKE